MEWISVNDRLPQDGQRVLVYRKNIYPLIGIGVRIYSEYREDYCYCMDDTKGYAPDHIVTHWMPLPELPKEKEITV